MFDGKYLDFNQKRIKGILDFYGHKFFYFKKVLDLGCGHADIGGTFHRLGADITAADARQEHLKIALKKYPGIKTVKTDLDRGWPFRGQSFDMIIDMDLICHLKDYETHLRDVCKSCTHLILESAVYDGDDCNKCVPVPENKAIYDLSVNGMGGLPTTNSIERILTECGMNFRRQDNNRYNTGTYKYDWVGSNDGQVHHNKRRLWFALKHDSPIQFAKQTLADISAPPIGHLINQSKPAMIPIQLPAPKTNIIGGISPGDKNFVIIIPSYKNAEWCEKNITSALNQNYNNFRVIFTDDNSPDDTFNRIEKIVRNHPKSDKCSIHKNSVRVGALENLYNMIVRCNDEEIILTLDGDDWLANDNVLATLNRVYSDEQIWMTYGQYKNFPDGKIGISKPIPHNIVNSNGFRQYDWCSSHLRTFYAWLFKKIKLEDLKHNGKFMTSAWDATIMYPQLEMSGFHSRFISDVLYIYNLDNPINDHKVDVKLQQWFDHYVRTMPKYPRVNKELTKKKIGLFLIATNKYDRFIQGMISSADNFFLKGNYEVTYYIFSDKQVPVNTSRNVVFIPIEHKPFPYASMDRFKHFSNNASRFDKEDYLFYVDVDCLFVDYVGPEILGNLTGVRHCGYFKSGGTYETNMNSVFYADPKSYKYYFGGGFSGGNKDEYLKLSRWCADKIDQDLVNGHMPLWHDETAINKYFLDNEPDVILSPSYHYPQGSIERYKKSWEPFNFTPKILLLEKNHDSIRS